MGEIMKRIAEGMSKDKELKIAIELHLKSGATVPMEIIKCLEDPTENKEVMKMIENVYKENYPKFPDSDPVDIRYFKRIRAKLDKLLGEVRNEIKI